MEHVSLKTTVPSAARPWLINKKAPAIISTNYIFAVFIFTYFRFLCICTSFTN